MSMLAEPRSRQKWSEDPQNTRWASDKNKFGYQMLTKMGWSEGTGLGQKGTGCVSHVKIKKKRNNLGVGMKTSHDDDWIAHQDQFNALLTQLNQGTSSEAGEKKLQSLEDRVRITKTKIMYSKFVKSKDLSRASKDDLACIFGQRSKSAPATPQRSEDEDKILSDDSTASNPIEKSKVEHGFTTVNTGVSVADYFAKKMAALKQQRSQTIAENSNIQIQPEEEQKKEVTGGHFSQINMIDDVDQKANKKKRRRKEDSWESHHSEGVDHDELVAINHVSKAKKKKKKKKVEKNDDIVICEKKEFSRDRTEGNGGESSSTTLQKKCKKRKYTASNLDTESKDNTVILASSKKSRKKESVEQQGSSALDGESENEYSRSIKKKKKKKKRKETRERDEE